MNRLIIIGNGFDLAHGLKTSATDFFLNYLSESVNNFYGNDKHSDVLLEVKFANRRFTSFGSNRSRQTTVNNVLHEIEKIRSDVNFTFVLKPYLLSVLYSKILELNWVDLEIEYFNVLINNRAADIRTRKVSRVKILNEQFDYLKHKLIEYLLIQQTQYKKSSNLDSLVNCFCEQITSKEIVTFKLHKDHFPKNLYFLNFNYTNTLYYYIKKCNEEITSSINYIHGNLSGEYGEPIFGFGDELNKKFLEFEDDQNNELFKHIKSFEYLKTKNFYELTRFIESEPYQVHIYGHSCGLSDRTLLNQIFEHDNCKSIKIFYHKISDTENDFTQKTYEIARHFKDKAMLRKKLVPFELSKEMPQPKMN